MIEIELIRDYLYEIINHKEVDEWLEPIEDEIKKLKQAIDILKNKNVNIKLLRISKSVDSYNCFISGLNFCNNLTQEEYELLKEVFDDE